MKKAQTKKKNLTLAKVNEIILNSNNLAFFFWLDPSTRKTCLTRFIICSPCDVYLGQKVLGVFKSEHHKNKVTTFLRRNIMWGAWKISVWMHNFLITRALSRIATCHALFGAQEWKSFSVDRDCWILHATAEESLSTALN